MKLIEKIFKKADYAYIRYSENDFSESKYQKLIKLIEDSGFYFPQDRKSIFYTSEVTNKILKFCRSNGAVSWVDKVFEEGTCYSLEEIFKDCYDTPMPKPSTKVLLIEGVNGCSGADGLVGVVTALRGSHGLLEENEGFNVFCIDNKIWRFNGTWVNIEECYVHCTTEEELGIFFPHQVYSMTYPFVSIKNPSSFYTKEQIPSSRIITFYQWRKLFLLPEKKDLAVGDFVKIKKSTINTWGYFHEDIGRIIEILNSRDIVINVPNRNSCSVLTPHVSFKKEDLELSTEEAYNSKNNYSGVLGIDPYLKAELMDRLARLTFHKFPPTTITSTLLTETEVSKMYEEVKKHKKIEKKEEKNKVKPILINVVKIK